MVKYKASYKSEEFLTGSYQNSIMATSPTSSSTLTPKKKEESFLDKLGGTLARKKKAKEGSYLPLLLSFISIEWNIDNKQKFE